MSTLTKTILTAIGTWLLTLILLFIFPHVLPTVTGFAIMFTLPIDLVLVILAFVALVKDKNSIWPAVSMALILLVSYFAFAHVMSFGALANFYLNKEHYETTAKAMISAGDDTERDKICGDKCRMMSTNPPRVAFYYVHGFLNWHNIVYDPSGTVINKRADEWLRNDVYFTGAEHLAGDWYLCHFRD